MKIRILLYQEINLLDVAGPAQVFEAAGRLQKDELVHVEFCMPGGGEVRSDTGLVLMALDSERLISAPDIFVVPGSNVPEETFEDQRLMAQLQRHAKLSHTVASICTGSMLLARAGLLRGRRATTHWGYAARFRELFPDTHLDADQIHVQDGDVWTSAGVSSGIDLSLALIEAQLGRALAVKIARDLVVPLIRTGGQKQFSAVLEMQSSDDAHAFSELHGWISQNLDSDLSVDALARHCRMSSRSFARRHKESTGTSPAKMVERLRVERGIQLLEASNASMKKIADICGFASVNAMRLAVKRVKGVDPTTYKKQFGQS